jgi:hypothetical protein
MRHAPGGGATEPHHEQRTNRAQASREEPTTAIYLSRRLFLRRREYISQDRNLLLRRRNVCAGRCTQQYPETQRAGFLAVRRILAFSRAKWQASATHTDSAHTDSEHTDSAHTDSEHTDSEHTDSEHTDSASVAMIAIIPRGNGRLVAQLLRLLLYRVVGVT